MTEHEERRRAGYTSFPDAPVTEEGIVAVLITKDPHTGDLKSYVRSYEGHEEPDPNIVGALLTAVEIANL